VNRTAVQEQFFRQRGFARVGMTDDGKRAPPFDCGVQLCVV
jgi:hypothetical protein